MNSKTLNFREIHVAKSIIKETEEFCRSKGKDGYEAKVYWIGKSESEGTALVTRVFIPKQLARKSLYGVSVEVPEEGNIELIESLKNDELALIKLHTHPRNAFLSKTDIENPFFRHEGAISIIIPDFCRKTLSNLNECCVNIFKNSKWIALNNEQIKMLFRIKE